MSVLVHKPGIQTTIQDLGRTGLQHIGVSVAGAVDDVSFRLANALLGNQPASPALEITLIGPRLEFLSPAWIAVTGADLSTSLVRGGRPAAPIDMYLPLRVQAGDIVEFGRRRSGLRAYLAVRGGWRVEPVLGSCSTHLRSGLGGLSGKPLINGQQLLLNDSADEPPPPAKELPRQSRSVLSDGTVVIRCVEGREFEQFTSESHRAFSDGAFLVLPQSDRMAYRLSGPALPRHDGLPDILSEGVAFGTVQVPPSGQAIVLMADRQTTGGYPRIAQVSRVDLPALAQLMPGERIRFRKISLAESQSLLLQREALMTSLF